MKVEVEGEYGGPIKLDLTRVRLAKEVNGEGQEDRGADTTAGRLTLVSVWVGSRDALCVGAINIAPLFWLGTYPLSDSLMTSYHCISQYTAKT